MSNADTYHELSESAIKHEALQILIEVDSFCRRNGINYYLGYGSLIGAIRHKGYIPWDDDIDIYMLRKDYDRFVASYNNDPNNQYKLIDYHSLKKYHLAFAKVISTETVLIEIQKRNPPEMGVYIDIFPLDYCGNDIDTSYLKYKKRIHPFILLLYINTSKSYLTQSKIKRILCYILRPISCIVGRKHLIKMIDKKSRKLTNGQETLYVAPLTTMTYQKRDIYKKEWFFESVDVTFEKHYFLAPAGFDELLSSIYGDYMSMPPVDKRISHHDYIAFSDVKYQ